ncbi:hypothetical protein GCM10018793_64970 [Streptomyces sulfonofaciens]|uniref:TAXI family TRAP transporter solute-binding subunit n=1 Tax=Streptomyces sulfonofaciens TaxID=68272 RepID=A0A919GPP7_9ACTN|nr:TAXI family TRAP transporter solute-binding subunit [Streptomyces sulfonofaciens]GHH87781.1 hypothetical protein GCM10018793_64970 [Streptomyces sulfonofaciens]
MRLALPRIGRARALQGSAAALVVLGLLSWWLRPWGEDPPHGTVAISTGARNGVYERYGELLKGELDEDMPDLDVRLLSSAGSQQNVQRVATGHADFTIAAADAVEQYRQAHGPGADRLRGCARLYDDYVQLVVPRLSPVRSITDLRHRRVAIGQTGSGVRLIAERVLRAAGLDPAKDIRARSTGIDTVPEALRHGDIDAFFWSGGLPTRAVTDLSEQADIRFIPLGGLVDALHRQGGASAYYRASDMPADAYPPAERGVPVSTLAVANLLVTTAEVDDELAERVTRAVIDSRDRIGRAVHAAQRVDLRTALYTDPLPLHAGASRYYRSVKP